MIWILVVPLGILALLAALPKNPPWLPGRVVPIYFMISLTGQINALPGMIAALALAVLTEGVARWATIAILVLFALAQWRNRIAGRLLLDAVGLTQTKIPLLAGLWPAYVGDGKVRRIRDLPYGDAGKDNRLDLVVAPDPRPEPMPILIHVHGGGWVMGKKNQQAKPLMNHLALNGWLCVDIDYRLGPVARFPAMIVDVLKAIAWVKEHAREHGGDPTRIAITGGSAGGHLTALAALAHDDPTFKPGFEEADCRVDLAMPIYGRFDFLDRACYLRGAHKLTIDQFMAEQVMPGHVEECRELWLAVSPLERVRADAPPMLITHGTGDTLLPFEDARDFARKLTEVSRSPVIFVELPGIEHAYDMGTSALTWAHVRALEAFLQPLTRPAQAGASDLPLPAERVLAAAG